MRVLQRMRNAFKQIGTSEWGRRRGVRILCGLILCGSSAAGLMYGDVRRAGDACYSARAIPPAPVAIVFGCGYSQRGPSPVMYDRVAKSVELYKAGKVRKLLMTGDNSKSNYNEPEMMRRTAIKMGVPAKDIVMDFAGFRTYDSLYRARDVFGVHRAILVSQSYHLPRALFIARQMGIEATGAPAEQRGYGTAQIRFSLREAAACEYAWVEARFLRPRPRYLGKFEPIIP